MPEPTRKIGLTLSGGGFRATLFHLGVVRFLYEAKLLPQVTHVCSVSGGSILAAHLVLNWERYTGDEKAFNEAARELVDFVQTDLRGRVVRSWLFSFAALGLPRLLQGAAWWRTKLLEYDYSRLYLGQTLRDLDKGGRPQLHILTASMSTGHLVSFGRSRVRVDVDPESKRSLPDQVSMPADRVPVALAVAASSAFPPLFPPVEVTASTFGADPSRFPNSHWLADGGVFDNLGIRKLLWVNREENVSFDLVVVSDAQREFTKEFKNEYYFIWGRASRSVDLLMDRVSWFENDSIIRLCREAQSELLECRLQNMVAIEKPYALSGPEQFALQNVRTDLDVFTPHEVNALVHQGYAVARAAWEGGRAAQKVSEGSAPVGEKVWHPLSPGPERPFNLHGAGRRKLGLFRAGHWASWVLWLLVLFYFPVLPGGVVGWLIYSKLEAQWAEAKANERKKDRDYVGQLDKKREEYWRDEALQLADKLNPEKKVEQHAAKKAQLVRTLSELALASGTDEWEKRRIAWDKLTADLENDPWFKNVFFAREDWRKVREAVKRRAPREELQRLTLDQAHALRGFLSGDPFKNFLKKIRAVWYEEVIEVVNRIAQKGQRLDEIPATRERFWELYWGELAMVEGHDVEQAMIAFGELLRKWEEGKTELAPDPGLAKEALAVEKACRDELTNHPD